MLLIGRQPQLLITIEINYLVNGRQPQFLHRQAELNLYSIFIYFKNGWLAKKIIGNGRQPQLVNGRQP